MLSGSIRHLFATMIVVALFSAATIGPDSIALADPSQDQKFFDLLGEEDIPPVDGENGLVTTAHKVCSRLDEGMAVGDMVELIRNNGFNDNPLTRLQNQARITRTIHKFINASVEAYCPSNKGKISSIAGYRTTQPPDRPMTFGRVVLTSLVVTVPAGDIAPTKPFPVPAQPPPIPQQVEPAPQEPPPIPRRVQTAPQQAPSKHAEAPPPESPPEAGPLPQPEAPAPAAPAPPEPASPPPDQPSPPGHVRLAP